MEKCTLEARLSMVRAQEAEFRAKSLQEIKVLEEFHKGHCA